MKFFLAAAALALACGFAHAHDYKTGTLEIAHPWTRATPKGATVAAGYLKITNNGAAADRLKRVIFELSPRVEIHEMTMSGNMMRMRELKAGLEIKPGKTVELMPGGYHIMFMGLKKPLEPGQRIKGALIFEKAGSVEVEFAVEALGAPATEHGKH
jgi:copper(I)-binding protein